MSRLSQYLNRSSIVMRDGASRMLRMAGADEPSRAPITLLTLNSREDMSRFAIGCDSDIGGTSSAKIELDETSADPKAGVRALQPLRPSAKFWGEMRLGAKPGFEGRVRGGYAGFRSQPRPTLFGEMVDDVSNHRFLALRVRVGGSPRTRNSYYVNIQTDGPITSDLWQHRIFFNRDDGGWEDIFIPFDNFVLTNTGEIQNDQMAMYRERLRTIGVSILGGNSGVEGAFELGVDCIRAVNEEDVTAEPKSEPSRGTQWQRQPV
ncbi:hypothetical protein PHLGIDRAFT_33842 [Phlebiopsis gigantea 11061_1 CR5-6]|uniref:NADH:ubiquinone oxidoreductase intermediate-associated protein 30 domain-containing protein n=1 Tax=Phlebiopsis gigantea (strain 11061_1 CR5-6) TaxID=745531 RepID=A0A0C3NYD7_PHLG1|nr:hypothetical protein PHLGIDRAFT_33842 [Phlebiopsis gigantea 11061_1 CR5-6]